MDDQEKANETRVHGDDDQADYQFLQQAEPMEAGKISIDCAIKSQQKRNPPHILFYLKTCEKEVKIMQKTHIAIDVILIIGCLLLAYEYNDLLNRYNALQANYNELARDYNYIIKQISVLHNQVNNLINKYNERYGKLVMDHPASWATVFKPGYEDFALEYTRIRLLLDDIIHSLAWFFSRVGAR